ncbi:MAG: type II toxin-antitoxin system Phd/YefM family antitoxin [Burkholderiaceae bacterium]|nr:type II toxin-antitoxin system Phd/YefM family antitoxin [Burkholderiaceae bacterium]MCD8537493.1 type II toxin-antitoxin system Phd/YefM family antitoxin [Burkholderiaceae bacterium]
MQAIYADYCVSISEFKKNPAQTLRCAKNKPVAVLSHNKTAFYMVTPELFETMVDALADLELAETVKKRITQIDRAIEVDIDSI